MQKKYIVRLNDQELARQVVELEIVDTVSAATLCRMLKKTA